MFWVLLFAAIEILGVITAVHAVMQVRTSQGAIAWGVSLIAFPLLAVPLYWIVGRNKFQGMAEAYRERAAEIDKRVERNHQALEPFVPDDGRAPTERSLEALAGHRNVGQNRVTLLIDGEDTFRDILAGIESAKQYVLVQFYLIRDDMIGKRLGDALIAKTGEGVPVYLLYDEIGSSDVSSHFLERLREHGVHVTAFNTTRGRWNRLQLNFRNHRKIVVVDGRSAWLGGHNVGDEYLGRDKKFGAWRDTHLRIDGPAALQAQATFTGDWYWATRDLLELALEPQPVPDASANVLIAPTSPASRLETASLIAVELLHTARDRIWIASPYFVPDRAVMAAMRAAALRGVDVRVMLCKRADSLAVHLASYWYLDALGGVGIRFYRYHAGFLHQKVVVVDDRIGSVGSMNWDSRSFRLNFEVSAIVENRSFAEELGRMFETDFEGCNEVGSGELAARGYFFRLAVQLARLASPLL